MSPTRTLRVLRRGFKIDIRQSYPGKVGAAAKTRTLGVQAMPDVAPTKVRILDAAESLFAARGVANTSMRQITSLAGVNVAAVNYHFGTKASLVEAVFARRLEPLNQERIRRVDDAVARNADMRDLLWAFLGPTFELLSSGEEGRQFVRLLGRSYTETLGTEDFLNRLYADALDRFVQAASKVLPGVPKRELMWRLHFVAGAVSYALRGRDVLGLIGGEEQDDPAALRSRLMPFLSAGLSAPPPSFEG